jgi:hypothetical protein
LAVFGFGELPPLVNGTVFAGPLRVADYVMVVEHGSRGSLAPPNQRQQSITRRAIRRKRVCFTTSDVHVQ